MVVKSRQAGVFLDVELTAAERLVKEIHANLVAAGYTPAKAFSILLGVGVDTDSPLLDGVMSDAKFVAYLVRQ